MQYGAYCLWYLQSLCAVWCTVPGAGAGGGACRVQIVWRVAPQCPRGVAMGVAKG